MSKKVRLANLIEAVKLDSTLTGGKEVTNEEALGLLIAQWAEWDSGRLTAVMGSAFNCTDMLHHITVQEREESA